MGYVYRCLCRQPLHMRELFIVARDEALRRALRMYIELAGIETVLTDGEDLFVVKPTRGSAVIAPAPELPASTAAYLGRGLGVHPIVLAPVPTPRERQAYDEAGAVYVPMEIDRDLLVQGIGAALG
jgi:hypothetical protein